MNVLACTGIPELESELEKYCVIRRIKVVDEIPVAALDWRPDAVLLSVFLPSLQTDMLFVCRELRRNGIRVVVLCGDNLDLARSFFEIGVHEFVTGDKVTVYKILQRLKRPMGTGEAAFIFQKRVETNLHRSRPAAGGPECGQDDQTEYGQQKYPQTISFEKDTGQYYEPEYVLIKQQEEENQVKYTGPPAVGFWGPKPGSGTGSIARAVAITASNIMKVLLVETDFRYPAAMFNLKMVDEDRCIEKAIQTVQENSNISISQFILNGRNCKKKADVPGGLNLLAPGVGRGIELFPKVESEETMIKIHEAVKEDFDLIVYDLASELDSYLTIGAMRQCTHLIVVVDGDPVVMSFLEKRLSLLKRLKIRAAENCVVVTNKLPKEIGVQKIQQILGLKVIQNISYDNKMSEAVMKMQPGGQAFLSDIEKLCMLLGVNRKKQPKQPGKAAGRLVWAQLKGEDKRWTRQLFSTTR